MKSTAEYTVNPKLTMAVPPEVLPLIHLILVYYQLVHVLSAGLQYTYIDSFDL